MIRIDEIHAGAGYRLILTPNCSMNWRHLLVFYFLTCAVAIVIGLLFALQGQWLILPFSGIEMLVLGAVLYITSRKSNRREVITVNKDRVMIEKGRRRSEHQWIFKRCWIRLLDELGGESRPRRKLALGSHGRYTEVGDFLNNIEKDELAFRLKDCIISR